MQRPPFFDQAQVRTCRVGVDDRSAEWERGRTELLVQL